MIVADRETTLVLTGTGDVLEPERGVMGIGSGGNYALAAARALIDTPLGAEEIARKAMAIAAEICVYTNTNVVLESARQQQMTASRSRLPTLRRSRLHGRARWSMPTISRCVQKRRCCAACRSRLRFRWWRSPAAIDASPTPCGVAGRACLRPRRFLCAAVRSC